MDLNRLKKYHFEGAFGGYSGRCDGNEWLHFTDDCGVLVGEERRHIRLEQNEESMQTHLTGGRCAFLLLPYPCCCHRHVCATCN